MTDHRGTLYLTAQRRLRMLGTCRKSDILNSPLVQTSGRTLLSFVVVTLDPFPPTFLQVRCALDEPEPK